MSEKEVEEVKEEVKEELSYDLIIDYDYQRVHVIESKKLTKEQIICLRKEDINIIGADQIEIMKNNELESKRVTDEIKTKYSKLEFEKVVDEAKIKIDETIQNQRNLEQLSKERQNDKVIIGDYYDKLKESGENLTKSYYNYTDKIRQYRMIYIDNSVQGENDYKKFISLNDLISYEFKSGNPIDIMQKYKVNRIWVVNVCSKYGNKFPLFR